ncbi:MAG TPA: hypothetical protein RMI62_03735, partial [Polyangiaceae bacterium LLY-WYZ-15_(1-7)]|nr:hypothetical protein [Polyangiaceae bacterium LLY-WYZ-15_(1-7)]
MTQGCVTGLSARGVARANWIFSAALAALALGCASPGGGSRDAGPDAADDGGTTPPDDGGTPADDASVPGVDGGPG